MSYTSRQDEMNWNEGDGVENYAITITTLYVTR